MIVCNRMGIYFAKDSATLSKHIPDFSEFLMYSDVSCGSITSQSPSLAKQINSCEASISFKKMLILKNVKTNS